MSAAVLLWLAGAAAAVAVAGTERDLELRLPAGVVAADAERASRAPDLELLLPAVLQRQYAKVDEVLGELPGGGRLLVAKGAVMGYEGIRHPVLLRAERFGEVVFGVANGHLDKPEKVAAKAVFHGKGAAAEVATEVARDKGGSAHVTIEQAATGGSGVLEVIVNARRALLLPVFELGSESGCAAKADCRAADYACILRAHAPCANTDVRIPDAARDELSAPAIAAAYMAAAGARPQPPVEMNPPQAGDKGRPWYTLGGPAPARLGFVDWEGKAHDVEMKAPGEGRGPVLFRVAGGEEEAGRFLQAEGLLIVDGGAEEGGALGKTAWVPHTPVPKELEKDEHVQAFFGWFWPDRTWTANGCLRVRDEWASAAGTTAIRPLDRVSVRVSSTLFFGIYDSWGAATTDGDGCFALQRTFTGPWAAASRDLRVLVDFKNDWVRVANPLDVSLVPTWGYFVLANRGWSAATNWNMGVMTFVGGQGGQGPPLANDRRREQAISFWGLMRLQDALWGRQLAFNRRWDFNYPTFGAVSVDLGLQAVFLAEDSWSIRTVFHEAMHIWHYQHLTGSFFPSIIIDLANGCSTHNCQENPNVAFLEGFAEFGAHRILCNDLWVSGSCSNRARGYKLGWLLAHPRCVANPGQCFGTLPVQPGLTNPGRLLRNDDGVTHALHLLTDDDFYRRDFLGAGMRAPVVSGVTLAAGCQWYRSRSFDLFDVMRAFVPGAGYPANIAATDDLRHFLARFRDINNVPQGFMDDRARYHDVQTAVNPWVPCRDPCPDPATYLGAPEPGVYDGANCRIARPFPAGGFIANNAYYVPLGAACPPGTTASGSDCFILTLSNDWFGLSITTDKLTARGLTRTPDNKCPIGTPLFVINTLGTMCHLLNAPAGTTLRVQGGRSLFSTTVSTGCPSGVSGTVTPDGCRIGTPPAGTNAFVWGGWFYYTSV